MQLFKKWFGKKDEKPADITRPVVEMVQTTPLSEDQLKTVSYEAIKLRPPQFLIGCGQSAGLQRDHNEDTLFYMSSILANGVNDIPFAICVVADGMGGHKNGEIASDVAARTFARMLIMRIYGHLLEVNPDPMEESLQETIEKAFNEVQKSVVRNAPGGGTTLTIALLLGEQVIIAHVGDSRAYFIYPDGRIQKLTKDHSLVQRMVDLEEITELEAQTHPHRNVLLKAMGQTEPVQPDIQTHQIPKAGHLMLCSDGLWGVISETEIYRIISAESDPVLASHRMIEAANRSGGPDNISVVLVKFQG
ncbi:MAG: protein phosphatase 2C domain-containing protein [Anaerolineaceae bacterium]|jgi:PPM family protein phosphatase|nr:protein phosphatase 2C domain-containing protein [Anaerolineaceae bacterium]